MLVAHAIRLDCRSCSRRRWSSYYYIVDPNSVYDCKVMFSHWIPSQLYRCFYGRLYSSIGESFRGCLYPDHVSSLELPCQYAVGEGVLHVSLYRST